MWQDSRGAGFFGKKGNVGAAGRIAHKVTATLKASRVLLEKTKGIWKGCCDRIFIEERYGIREQLVVCHINC